MHNAPAVEREISASVTVTAPVSKLCPKSKRTSGCSPAAELESAGPPAAPSRTVSFAALRRVPAEAKAEIISRKNRQMSRLIVSPFKICHRLHRFFSADYTDAQFLEFVL
jgi:hypothetical protein